MSARRIRAAVLLSGSGRTLANFLERIAAGELPVEITAVVSSRPKVRGVAIARRRAWTRWCPAAGTTPTSPPTTRPSTAGCASVDPN